MVRLCCWSENDAVPPALLHRSRHWRSNHHLRERRRWRKTRTIYGCVSDWPSGSTSGACPHHRSGHRPPLRYPFATAVPIAHSPRSAVAADGVLTSLSAEGRSCLASGAAAREPSLPAPVRPRGSAMGSNLDAPLPEADSGLPVSSTVGSRRVLLTRGSFETRGVRRRFVSRITLSRRVVGGQDLVVAGSAQEAGRFS